MTAPAAESGRRRPSASALRDGIRRVLSAPVLLVCVWILIFATALPLALTLRGMLQDHLDASLAASAAAEAVNYDWWQEFEAQAAGLGTSFTPSVIGFAAVLDNISSIADARGKIAPVASAVGAYLLLWTFLMGGIIDRYARQRPTRAHGFFAAAGVFFVRFVRLAIAAAIVYWVLFGMVHPWLFDTVLERATRDLDVERTAFLFRLTAYAVFGALVVVANVLFDYAKIRAVVEDRRSMLGALAASMRFVLRNPGRVVGLYALNTLGFLVLLALWALVAPGAGGAGPSMWIGFLAAQVYVAARLILKLTFLASQTALFQQSLAHAGYTAAPEPVWPESPGAERIHPPRG
jgi:hypothetical protein